MYEIVNLKDGVVKIQRKTAETDQEGANGMSIHRLLGRLFRDEEGQSTTEYILILAVVVMIAMRFKKMMEGRMEGIVNKLGEQIDSSMNSIGPN